MVLKSKLIAFLFILGAFVFSANHVHAQRNSDSLSVVDFFGTAYAVKDGRALMLSELKHMVRENPAAFKEFKRARRLRTLSIALNVVAIVPLAYALASTTEAVFWTGTISAGLVFGSIALIEHGPYSRSIIKTVKLHNESLRVKQ